MSSEQAAFVVSEADWTQLQAKQSRLENSRVTVQEREQQLEQTLRKAREDGDKEWSKTGSKKNYRFVRKVEDKLEEVEQELQKCADGERVQRMRKIVQEGKTLCAARRKQIVLADKHDWAVVEEMENDSEVEDDDEDRRLRKAQKRVEERKEKEKKRKPGGRGKGSWGRGGKGKGKGYHPFFEPDWRQYAGEGSMYDGPPGRPFSPPRGGGKGGKGRY
jgi:hypothetical protein